MPAGRPSLPAMPKMPDLPLLPETLPVVTQMMQMYGEQMLQHVVDSIEGCAATLSYEWILEIEVED